MAFLLIVLLFCSSAVSAEVPVAIKEIMKKTQPQIQFRLDDIAFSGSNTWLLIKPRKEINLLGLDEIATSDSSSPPRNDDLSTQIELILKTPDDDYLFSNGWIYTPIKDSTIKSFDYYPEVFQDLLIQSTVHQSFLVPENFKLPRDLAMLAGRLPIELSSVELATEREILYEQRLKEEQKTNDFEFLSYTAKNGQFNLIKINREEDKSIDGLEIEAKDDISEAIHYASKLKKIDGEIYISDQVLGKIFLLKKEAETEFDATKPLQVIPEQNKEITKLETFLDLADYAENTGIKDFEFNKAKTNSYILTALDSKLHIIDNRKKIIIKSIQLPASVDGMKLVSRSVSEPDKLIFRSRSGAKIFTFNTFDYRVSTTLNLNEMNETYRFIPHDLLVSDDYILVAAEAIYKDTKLPKDSMGKILALDPITGTLISVVDISFVPYSLAFSGDRRSFFAVGSNLTDKTIISKLDSKELKTLASADLSPDIIDSKNITASSAGTFMLVPSAASNQVGVIDLETCTLIKKLDLGASTDVLLAL